jgi:uncharacterized repeat protein (TIGR03803 family)
VTPVSLAQPVPLYAEITFIRSSSSNPFDISRNRAALLLFFCMATSAAQAQTATAATAYSFPAGAFPVSSLIQAGDGNFYGVTNLGGTYNEGSIYRLTPAGAYSSIYSFTGLSSDGGEPAAGLTQAGDGNLYGTTTVGGANEVGTIFNISLQGVLSTMHSFDPDADGNTSYAALTLGSDGSLYGTLSQGGYTSSNGTYAGGTIFSISTAGIYSNLASLPRDGSQGLSPSARLIQASDGALYGTTAAGGAHDMGTLFSYSSQSGVRVLYNFTLADGSPLYGLIQSGSTLYGATFPNPDGNGEIFSVALPTKSLSVLFSFSGNSNGGLPATALFPAGNGAIYGTTQSAGSNDTGTLFDLSVANTLATLYDFPAGSINTYTDAALLQGSDGNFYDAVILDTTIGLDWSQLDGAGTLFRFTPSQSVTPPVTLTPSASTVLLNQPFMLNWNVASAASLTAQQCFATTGEASPVLSWSGSKSIAGSQSVTLSSVGTYLFGLTCGGTVSATATVTAVESSSAATQLSGPSSVAQGQHATLVATVTPSVTGAPTPTGSITFIADGSITLATIPLNSAIATFAASSAGVPPGTYFITAQYNGDDAYSAVTSPALKVTVTSPSIGTTTSLVASPNPVASGQTVALTATVQPASGSVTPTGTVQFLYQSVVIGSAQLSAGKATLRASTAGVAAGSYPVTAAYLGNSTNKASNSPHVKVIITD